MNSTTINNSGTFSTTGAANCLSTLGVASTTASTSPTTGALIVAGGVGVGGYITCAGGVTASGGLRTDGTNYFGYTKGSWTPTLRGIKASSSSTFSWTGISYQTQNGFYTKIGNLVTVWYDIVCSMPGSSNAYTTNFGFLAIGGLPYKILNSSTAINLSSQQILTNSSWPNGIAGDSNIPSIASPTFPYPYTAIAYEYGATVPLSEYIVVNVSDGNWTATGYDLLLYGQTQVFGVEIGIPPYSLIGSAFTQITNFNILSTVPNYTNIAFSGSISYYTD
jgi:hypothetical protein